MFTLPENFIDNIISYAGQTISDFLPLILLIFGVYLAIFIILSILEFFLNKN
jgi:hypothetical protein